MKRWLWEKQQNGFGDALVITGHSLGGGLAATAALATGTLPLPSMPRGCQEYTQTPWYGLG